MASAGKQLDVEGFCASGSRAIVLVYSAECIQAQNTGEQHHTSNNPFQSTQQFQRTAITAKTLMPLNIKQIVEAWSGRKAGSIFINNTIVSSVKLIGRVSEKKHDELKGSFLLEDCSGTMKASIWFTYSSNEFDSILDGAYVKVVGRLKLDESSPAIQCFCCKAVTNFNDITHHHLSVIATHIDLVQRPAISVHQGASELWRIDRLKMGLDQAQRSDITFIGKLEQARGDRLYPKAEITTPESKATVKEYKNGMNTVGLPTSDAIMHILRDESPHLGPEGLHIQLICKKLMTDEKSIRPYMDDLALAGELYTTVDQDHFAHS